MLRFRWGFVTLALVVVLGGQVVPSWTASDTDGDGIADSTDSCPLRLNPAQVDSDGDRVGNACDACPYVADSSQTDGDGDGVGDACDDCAGSEADVPVGDETKTLGVDLRGCAVTQYCPCAQPLGSEVPWRFHGAYVRCVRAKARRLRRLGRIDFGQHRALVNIARAAACGGPNATPGDSDGDGVFDDGDETGVVGDLPCASRQVDACDDNCPRVWNPRQADLDGDGRGDSCDRDADDDGTPTDADNCPRAKNADQADADDDGVGDVCDSCCTSPVDADVNASGCAAGEAPTTCPAEPS
jgi:Thrombospondin type 3 repeat